MKRNFIQKNLFILLIIPPLLFYLLYYFFFTHESRILIDNIYKLPVENEIYIFGDFVLNHGIIKLHQNDTWDVVFKKVKRFQKGYKLKKELKNQPIPIDFMYTNELNLDKYLIKQNVKNKDNKNGRFKKKSNTDRGLRYR